ncbi:hypothetical protein [Deinococcus sp. Leaf326]|uniref:hypothetical protein n=1 Tax=Deinococcus sp. Leaf326 TaxID=1736338 RepID=UPI000A40BB83|nr:hypothetical protein [Deinococcus sp. Leaf326]
MTTFQEPAHLPLPIHDAPLPEMKAKASELYYLVKGSEREKDYRRIAGEHPDKDSSRERYERFLEEIQAMFAAPVTVTPESTAMVQDEPTPRPDVATQALVTAPSEPDAADPGEDAPEDQEEGEGTGSNDPQSDLDGLSEDIPGEDAADAEESGEDEASTDEPEAAGAGSAAPTPTAPTASAPVPATSSGLLAQLAGMLADGGQLNLQLMRVGEQLTVGIFPQPHPGEQGPQPLIVTNTADWLDHHLVGAMQAYAGARQDAFAVCASAAARQQAANKKAATTPATKTPAPSKPGPKTFKFTLTAAEGTTLTAKQEGKDVPLVLGENTITQGTLEVVATHELFGETKKTFAMWTDKTHDLREQQGGHVTVKVTPEDAALTAVQGERRIPFHGETLLPAGAWVIEAEAAEHDMGTQKIHVKAGKPQDVELTLKLSEMGSLF